MAAVHGDPTVSRLLEEKIARDWKMLEGASAALQSAAEQMADQLLETCPPIDVTKAHPYDFTPDFKRFSETIAMTASLMDDENEASRWAIAQLGKITTLWEKVPHYVDGRPRPAEERGKLLLDTFHEIALALRTYLEANSDVRGGGHIPIANATTILAITTKRFRAALIRRVQDPKWRAQDLERLRRSRIVQHCKVIITHRNSTTHKCVLGNCECLLEPGVCL